MIEADIVKLFSLHQRRELVKYIESLRMKKLDTLASAPDMLTTRRAQGAASAYKELARVFAE